MSGRRKNKNTIQAPMDDNDNFDAPALMPLAAQSAPAATVVKPRRAASKSADDLRRIMDIIQSRILVIIDTLEGDENEMSTKRNVATAVKHLKQIDALLSA